MGAWWPSGDAPSSPDAGDVARSKEARTTRARMRAPLPGSRGGWDSRAMKAIALLLAVLFSAAAVAACGESKQDKAKSQVCDARDDIGNQVDTLKGLTVSSATTDKVRDSLTAISDDVKKIANAQGDLSSERKSQVQQANATFTSQVKDIAASLGTSTSLSDAAGKLKTALDQLASSYQQTFAKISC
jgi:uncharacterized phage infection (PIP) family protein YhgE